MAVFGRSLRDTLKKLAYQTSVDQLKKNGVNQVKVVGVDRIIALVEEAVHRTLRSKLAGLERSQVAGETKEEFLRLLRANAELEKSRDEAVQRQRRAEEEVDELRRALAEGERELKERLAEGERALRANYEGENDAIAQKINEILLDHANQANGQPAALRDRVLELVMDLVGQERRSALAAQQSARDREVELLQRRIHKLSTALEASEHKLARAGAMSEVDDGISSVYREVQGLDQTDRQFRRKNELMSEIFRANLALQKNGIGR